ncbi:hypothetical protein JAAARDRAFT_171726 [Jaapia argillacea MUCL 33604]|uniref:BTB domain-containing protein n=1 Tax=Jaapia argillacea MUCL 33604 TaxID=933084 RepID=A0A067QDD4_9AGAM|nr:hypothetical protein JAAARDRAFT_171726 [Jaapia argillacea MUCL 33604]
MSTHDLDTAPAQTKYTPPPLLDHPHADVILHTPDNVDFRVFKLFLSLASPVFRDMFSLPQPDPTTVTSSLSDADPGEHAAGRTGSMPIIDMTEDHLTLERMLRFYYPGSNPDMTTCDLEGARKLLDAAIKYEMDELRRFVVESITSPRFLEKDPIGVFAIGCHHKIEQVVLAYAKYTLRRHFEDLLSFKPSMTGITVEDYSRLLQYHWRCGVAASGLTSAFEWIGYERQYRFLTCPDCAAGEKGTDTPTWENPPRKWWVEYMKSAGGLLKSRPHGGFATQFSVYNKHLNTGLECKTCRRKAVKDMRDFVQGFDRKIEELTSMVALNITFQGREDHIFFVTT